MAPKMSSDAPTDLHSRIALPLVPERFYFSDVASFVGEELLGSLRVVVAHMARRNERTDLLDLYYNRRSALSWHCIARYHFAVDSGFCKFS